MANDDSKNDTQTLDTIYTCETCDHNNTFDCIRLHCTCCFEICNAMRGNQDYPDLYIAEYKTTPYSVPLKEKFFSIDRDP